MLILGIAIGPVGLTISQVVNAMAHPGGSTTADVIVGSIREPRVLCAAIVGAALAVSGAASQAIFKNPMADPGIIGVSAGGAFGAVLALALSWAVWSPFLLPLSAFVAAAITVFLVYRLATRRGRTSLIGVLLAGMVISSMISAGLSLILTFANNEELRGIVFWLMGGFAGDSWTQLWIVAVPVGVGLVAIMLLTRELDLLQTGEDSAHSSGVRVEAVKRLLIALVALMTGSAVAISGVIAFVGLVVPHVARRLVGPRHALVIPASALFGASLLVAADTLGRSIIPTMEINVGIVTSFIGGPFFLYLLLRAERLRTG